MERERKGKREVKRTREKVRGSWWREARTRERARAEREERERELKRRRFTDFSVIKGKRGGCLVEIRGGS